MTTVHPFTRGSFFMSNHTDRRAALRRRTLKGAQIVFNNRRNVIDCTVRNISATGALLALPNTTGVPDQFALYMESGRRLARVVWKSDRTVGVVWSTDAGQACPIR
jgi:PilZ domain